MAATVKVARQQTTPELSGTFRTLPPEPTPAYTGTRRNLPEPSGTCLRNLHHFTPELSGTFWNPPPEPTPAHSGTFRNLPLEPAPATRTGAHRGLSGLKTPLAFAVGEIFLILAYKTFQTKPSAPSFHTFVPGCPATFIENVPPQRGEEGPRCCISKRA